MLSVPLEWQKECHVTLVGIAILCDFLETRWSTEVTIVQSKGHILWEWVLQWIAIGDKRTK